MEKKKEKSFEEKLNELEKLVKEIESGEIPLDEVINKFNEAMILAKDCDKTLKDATATVKKILKDGQFEELKNEE